MTPKPTRGFTAEDLAQLKERMKFVGDDDSLFGPLLARLEAAEKVCYLRMNRPRNGSKRNQHLQQAVESWRKACGK